MSTCNSKASVSVYADLGLIYVLIEDKATFRALPGTARAGQCLSKKVEGADGAPCVVFQYWGEDKLGVPVSDEEEL